MRPNVHTPSDPRGMSLVELMIALILIAVGILAVGRMFPTGARAQVQDRLLTGANYYAQEKLEDLTGRTWSDSLLADGRHPAGTATESLGNGNWKRFWTVSTLAAPLDNLKRVDVNVTYKGAGQLPRTITATTYMRR